MKPILACLILTGALVTGQPALAQSNETGADDGVEAAMMRPVTTGVVAMTIEMTGAAEVPGPGDSDGTGEAFLILHPNGGKVCYALSVSGTQPPSAAHIHEGSADESGGPVVPLPTADNLAGCVTAESSLLRQISANPDDYYVNVHNAEYPGGAVRGQLGD